MKSLLPLLALMPALYLGCSGQIIVDGDGPGCEPVGCRMYCEYGFVTGEDGCEICECAPPPTGCPAIGCDLYCETGYQKDANGCEICACLPSNCEGPNPAGCIVNGCPTDSYCDTSVGCTSSDCTCDSFGWACTDDCGGGTCVPAGGPCGENPAGCAYEGCPTGEICDTTLGCLSSGCSCDPESGTWACDADCGGGYCVPDPTGCAGPNPAGCMGTACPIGQVCTQTSGLCVPSSCACDSQSGMWFCTDDCGGGICVDE